MSSEYPAAAWNEGSSRFCHLPALTLVACGWMARRPAVAEDQGPAFADPDRHGFAICSRRC